MTRVENAACLENDMLETLAQESGNPHCQSSWADTLELNWP